MYKQKYMKYKSKYLFGGNSNKIVPVTNDSDMSYPVTHPYNIGKLKVDSIHTLHYEENGNPNGKPIVFLHGGPGGGISKNYSALFDKSLYRVIAFDQRGCGNSTPYAALENNTTNHLIDDIEKIMREEIRHKHNLPTDVRTMHHLFGSDIVVDRPVDPRKLSRC